MDPMELQAAQAEALRQGKGRPMKLDASQPWGMDLSYVQPTDDAQSSDVQVSMGAPSEVSRTRGLYYHPDTNLYVEHDKYGPAIYTAEDAQKMMAAGTHGLAGEYQDEQGVLKRLAENDYSGL